MMSITQLEYVLALDQYRHFGKASKACFVTQPTLSMQIQKLEDDLGVLLFDRSKKPILPTDEGKSVIRQARIILAEVTTLKELHSKSSPILEGTLKLAIIPTLAPSLIPLFLEEFSTQYPKINLEIQERQTSQIIEQIEHDQIDAGILVTPLEHATLREDRLFDEPFYIYAHRDHPFAQLKKVRPSAMDGKDLWLLEEGHCFRNQMLKICSSRKMHRVLKNVVLEGGSLKTLTGLVESTRGFTLLPALEALKLAHSSMAKLIPFSEPIPTREVSLVLSRTQHKKKMLSALKSLIQLKVKAALPLPPRSGRLKSIGPL